MQENSTKSSTILVFRQEVERQLRVQIRQAVEVALDEELAAALGSGRHERTDARRGYRHGTVERRLTTGDGLRVITVPRGRVVTADGTTAEFRSALLPPYARRTREVDDAILSCYLAGVNSRRIRAALQPLLGAAHLSKSAVSLVVSRLKALFANWQTRELATERYAIVFLDGFHLKVRLARRVVAVPVLAVLGVTETGEKRLVALRLAVSEAAALWNAVLRDLAHRGLPAPVLVVMDGAAGLKEVRDVWPAVRVQRCTTHKWRNLESHCPVHARAELKRDYDRILYAMDGLAARATYDAFVKKWTTLCPPVARSLEEAGLELLTFYDFPKAMWKSLRTTNALENLHREFRRRTKTQASFGTEDAALTLLFGLVAFGQIQLRRIDGYQHLPSLLAKAWQNVA